MSHHDEDYQDNLNEEIRTNQAEKKPTLIPGVNYQRDHCRLSIAVVSPDGGIHLLWFKQKDGFWTIGTPLVDLVTAKIGEENPTCARIR